jgi:hypothetical protein
MNQLLFGAAIPFAIGAVIYIAKGLRAGIGMLIAVPVFMAVTMLWAVAPDLPRLFGMGRLYQELSLDARCNIFFWHYSIDRIESNSVIYPVLFVLMWALLLGAAWRELYLRERNR